MEAGAARSGADAGSEGAGQSGRKATPAQIREQLDLVDRLRKSSDPAPPPVPASTSETSTAVPSGVPPSEELQGGPAGRGGWLSFLGNQQGGSGAGSGSAAAAGPGSDGTVGAVAPLSTEFDSQVTKPQVPTDARKPYGTCRRHVTAM